MYVQISAKMKETETWEYCTTPIDQAVRQEALISLLNNFDNLLEELIIRANAL